MCWANQKCWEMLNNPPKYWVSINSTRPPRNLRVMQPKERFLRLKVIFFSKLLKNTVSPRTVLKSEKFIESELYPCHLEICLSLELITRFLFLTETLVLGRLGLQCRSMFWRDGLLVCWYLLILKNVRSVASWSLHIDERKQARNQ